MHYYKRNLGDYAKKAGRLSMLQHGSYTLLIDACYDREQFPTLDEAIEWTWASSTEEVEAVTFVLRKFFILENGFYIQKRIKEEIGEYHSKSEINKRIAINRETKRKENNTNRAENNTNRDSDVNEPPPNHKPLTNNQEPLKTKQKTSKKIETNFFPDINPQIVLDYLSVRKAKAKNAPISQTVFDGLQREATKAGYTIEQALTTCIERNWVGFNADWVLNDQRQTLRDKPSRMDISKVDYKYGVNADGSF